MYNWQGSPESVPPAPLRGHPTIAAQKRLAAHMRMPLVDEDQLAMHSLWRPGQCHGCHDCHVLKLRCGPTALWGKLAATLSLSYSIQQNQATKIAKGLRILNQETHCCSANNLKHIRVGNKQCCDVLGACCNEICPPSQNALAAKYPHSANHFIKPRAELLLQPLLEPWANSTLPSPCASPAAPCKTARGRSGSSKLQVHTLAAAALFSFIILKTSLVHSLLDHFPGPLLTPHTREGNTDFSFCFWVALSLIVQPEIVHDRGEGNSVAKKKDEKSSASCMESTLQQFCTMREVSKNTGKEPFSLYKVTNNVTCLKWTWHHLQGNFAASDASKSRFGICLWLLWAWNIAST